MNTHPTTSEKENVEAWFQPMGLTLHLISNSPAIIEAAKKSFGGFGPGQPNPAPDFTFRLFAHRLDDGQASEPLLRRESSLLYQTTGRDSTLVADLAPGFAYGYFSPTTLAQPTFFCWHFLELAFFMMLEWRGFMGVHGAALVKNGQAILLRAKSGGGKTTLAYAGARSRYQALAEDVVWFDGECNLWWGLPWAFHLLPDAKQLFPELSAYQPVLQTNKEMKLEVNLETIRAGSTTTSAKPGAVVFIERLVGGKSRLEPLSLAAARATWPGGSTGLEMKLAHHQPYIEALLTQKSMYRLYFGDDIEVGVKLLDPLFE